MGVLIDSNVLLDILGREAPWKEWSLQQLRILGNSGESLVINPLIFAELSLAYDTYEQVDEALPRDWYEREALPWEAAFLAGKCFVEYRRRGGDRRSPMPDFYIGAHAMVKGYRLLTRDDQRYRTYFPRLRLITPPGSRG